MPLFHPLIYSVPDGEVIGDTVEASDADEACRKVTAELLEMRGDCKTRKRGGFV